MRTHVKLTINESHRPAERAMSVLGHDAVDAALIADHRIDCELRGLGTALSAILSLSHCGEPSRAQSRSLVSMSASESGRARLPRASVTSAESLRPPADQRRVSRIRERPQYPRQRIDHAVTCRAKCRRDCVEQRAFCRMTESLRVILPPGG
jgi:hypothetical protein